MGINGEAVIGMFLVFEREDAKVIDDEVPRLPIT
jgi:hypothetical protein